MGPSRPLLIRYPFLRALYLFCIWWVITLATLTILYFAWIREYQMNWGASAADASRYMAGDELIIDPHLNATRAIEIEAPPEKIWPWIVQMGYNRGGFYGFDKLDNGGFPSAEVVLPEWQDVAVGDSIPITEHKGTIYYLLEVVEMEPGTSMLWVFIATPWSGATWSWGLYPIDDNRTKLVSRLRHTYPIETVQGKLIWGLLDVMEIFMMRTTLRGIKRRAESL